VTGLDYQTLRNYASVARRFELSRRRDKLTFQHHAVVRALTDEEQDHWLTLAEENHWSRNELRRAIRARKLSNSGDDPISSGSRLGDPLTISPPPARLARWRAEAEKAGLELEEWIVTAVERWLSGQPSAIVGSRRRAARRGTSKAA
jgi:hypothetical protein